MSTRLGRLRESVRSRTVVLQNRQFRRLLGGRTVSVLGDGFYTVAAMWLVYELTGSTAYTGLAGFLTNVPGVLNFLVGPVVDRAKLGRILTYSEVVQGILVLVVPLAYALGYLNVYVVLTVMPLLALSNLFAMPAQNATLPRLLDDDELVRANSVFSMATKTVDAAARGIAGAVIAVFGAIALYLVDAGTFALATLLFLSLSVPGDDEVDDESSLAFDEYVEDLREGFGILTDSIAGPILVASLFANFLTAVTLAVLPAFADTVGGSATYGLLLSGMTVGNVLGSVTASVVDRYPFGVTAIIGFLISSVLWTGAVVVAAPIGTVVLFAASRVPAGVYNVFVMATFQTGVPDDLLGRVTSAVSSSTNIVYPLGMLVGGLLGEHFGSQTVMLLGGIGTFLMAAYWFTAPSLRRFGSPTEVSSGEFAK